MRPGLRAGLLFALAWALATTTLEAAPLDPALRTQLLAIYDDYNRAIAAGRIDEALALRSEEARRRFRREVTNAKERREFLELSRLMVPDGLEARHATLAKDGERASILAIARKQVPPGVTSPHAPPPGTVMRVELTLDFVKEGGAWKYDRQTFGMDPDAITPCRDERFEPITAYDEGRSLSLGGPIVRVAFHPDHTLVVLRVLDEETCAFLPPRDRLVAHGFDPERLAAHAILSGEGHPHKSDPRKAWIEAFSVEEE